MNLDSEEDGVLTVGCAGSTDTWVHVDAPREACSAGSVTLSLAAGGGLGGHSGVQIALGRANAVKVLGRVLREAHAAAPFRLVSLNGGKSRNAIPRDAVAVCSVPADQEGAFRTAVEAATATVRDAYAKTDPGATVTVEATGDAADAWTEEATTRLLDVVALVPTGPLAMSPDFDRARGDEHLTRGGHHRRRAADAPQLVAFVQRLRAPRGHRRARCSCAPRRWHARGEAQLQRLAPRTRLAPSRRRADGL